MKKLIYILPFILISGISTAQQFPFMEGYNMDPFHLSISTEITEAVFLVGNRVVIEEGLQPDALNVQDPAETFEHLDDFPGQPEALSDLPRKEARLHGPLFLRDIPGGPSKQRVAPLLVNVGIELWGPWIIDHEKVPFNLSRINRIGQLK